MFGVAISDLCCLARGSYMVDSNKPAPHDCPGCSGCGITSSWRSKRLKLNLFLPLVQPFWVCLSVGMLSNMEVMRGHLLWQGQLSIQEPEAQPFHVLWAREQSCLKGRVGTRFSMLSSHPQPSLTSCSISSRRKGLGECCTCDHGIRWSSEVNDVTLLGPGSKWHWRCVVVYMADMAITAT